MKKITPKHNIVKLLIASDKEKILTPVRGKKRHIISRGRKIRMRDFSPETIQTKDKDERFLTGNNTS